MSVLKIFNFFLAELFANEKEYPSTLYSPLQKFTHKKKQL